jgi:hypothetical protein
MPARRRRYTRLPFSIFHSFRRRRYGRALPPWSFYIWTCSPSVAVAGTATGRIGRGRALNCPLDFGRDLIGRSRLGGNVRRLWPAMVPSGTREAGVARRLASIASNGYI